MEILKNLTFDSFLLQSSDGIICVIKNYNLAFYCDEPRSRSNYVFRNVNLGSIFDHQRLNVAKNKIIFVNISLFFERPKQLKRKTPLSLSCSIILFYYNMNVMLSMSR